MSDINLGIGPLVKKYRTIKGYSIRELARNINVTASMLSQTIAEKKQRIASHGHQRSEDESFGKRKCFDGRAGIIIFLCFFDGVKYQNHIAIHDGSIYNRESKLENNRKQ